MCRLPEIKGLKCKELKKKRNYCNYYFDPQ